MTLPYSSLNTAAAALCRLRADQAGRTVAEQRMLLAILSERLHRAARGAMTEHLAGRVRSDRRFAPLLGSLMRMALDG